MKLRVTSKQEGFCRGGRAWTKEAQTVDSGEFTPEQLARIRAEPMLAVTEISEAEAEALKNPKALPLETDPSVLRKKLADAEEKVKALEGELLARADQRKALDEGAQMFAEAKSKIETLEAELVEAKKLAAEADAAREKAEKALAKHKKEGK